MKTLLVAVALGSSVASAEPAASASLQYRPHTSSDVWLDVGALWARVDPGNGNAYAGKLVRFAPHAMIGRLFYIGAELDIGTITGTDSAAIARGGTGPTMDPSFGGSLAAMKAVAGARVMAGTISAAAELAAGIRHASLETASGMEVAGVGDRGIVEAHARLDWWATPTITIGALAGMDLSDSTNLLVGLQVGLHVAP